MSKEGSSSTSFPALPPLELEALSALAAMGIKVPLIQPWDEKCKIGYQLEDGHISKLKIPASKLQAFPPALCRLCLSPRFKTLIIGTPEIKRITRNEAGELIALDLSNINIVRLPPEIGQLTTLQKLYLDDTKIAQLPPELWHLTSLRKLSLVGSKITVLPPEICQLTSLEYLDLRSLEIHCLPPEIGQLTALQTLDCSMNFVTILPPEILNLPSLQDLSLGALYVRELPDIFIALLLKPQIKSLAFHQHGIRIKRNEKGNLIDLSLRMLGITALPQRSKS